jgi:hypothetical protein
VAAYSVEAKHLASTTPTLSECCEAIEEVLRHANELLPSLRAMQSGERTSSPEQHRLPDVTVYHGTDGAVAVEVDTLPMGESLHEDGIPWLRVYVNEALVSDDSPPESLPGSQEARGEDDPDPAAPIGRLVVEHRTEVRS